MVVYVVVFRVEQGAINFHATCFLITEVLGRVEEFNSGDLVDCCFKLRVVGRVLLRKVFIALGTAFDGEKW